MRNICMVECRDIETLISLSSTKQTEEERNEVALIYVLNPDLKASEKFTQLLGLYSDEDIDNMRQEATGRSNDNKAMLALFWNYLGDNNLQAMESYPESERDAHMIAFAKEVKDGNK